MKTERTVFQQPLYIFAEAKSEYELENLDPGELPFTYKVKTFDYGDENCVRLCEQEVTVTVPEGIDITMECVRNLEERIEVLETECRKQVAKLRERIRALALIEYKPDVIEGELEEETDGA